jgi:hypothetical protein
VRHLTGYFLLISVGGALGGIFSALIAPVVFKTPLEYFLLLLAACLLRLVPATLPTPARERMAAWGDLLLPFALNVLIVVTLWLASPAAPSATRPAAAIAVFAIPAVHLVVCATARPPRAGAGAVPAAAAAHGWIARDGAQLLRRCAREDGGRR